ncbi:MAG: DUF3040 domain-containing protein [Actinobacteria bacterium]|nr:DUF3040 domain-containing protein [Actinomycetota bacterium]MSW26141.1 DUF3040 domain-containing protein [Actinomycetota bacterium]MSW33724.1 DUF3040 domain-containing protein [Actinomycetota bacterium]MSX31586.1 DUF3040 domain-containing protein [Actinomycetota bacterium]MSX51772.1 DUF3040 domain-containing protein [Actinomycetota bacterium]
MSYCGAVGDLSVKGDAMPLSEHERALLAEMEEALSVDDPGLVSTLTGTRLYPGRTRVLLGISLILGGLVTLFAGLISKAIALGIFGFLISLGGVSLAIAAATGMSAYKAPKASKRGKRSINSRLEDRWERRNFDK